jgi:hypothetical protein
MPSLRGAFLIWEPDGKSPPGHRLLDSDRPATSSFKYGSLTTDAETILLKKNRIFIWVLAFAASTPVWGGLIIGLSFLLDLLAKSVVDRNLGLTFLFSSAVVISMTIIIIGKVFKPIRRQFSRSQIANARINHVQSLRNNAQKFAGQVGVDFSVMPPGAYVESAQGSGSLRIANPEKCSFVTFIALGEAEARALREWLPMTQAALGGKINPDIPPQQAAPKMSTQSGATASGRPGGDVGVRTEKRYSHNIKLWTPGLAAVFNGYLAFGLIHEAVTNNRGLIINGVIHFGPTGATILYYLIAALFCFTFSALAAVLLRCLFNPHSLLLGPDGITFFKGWLKRKKIFVPYQSIGSLFQQQNVKGGSRTLIFVVKNQRFEVAEAYLKNRSTYDEIYEAIESGRTSARKISVPPLPQKTPDDDSRYMPKM